MKNLVNGVIGEGGMLDTVQKKVVSRKLMVWLTATGLMFNSNLASGDWVAISLAYIGIQGVADIAATWKHGK
jgi:hypothetical protein